MPSLATSRDACFGGKGAMEGWREAVLERALGKGSVTRDFMSLPVPGLFLLSLSLTSLGWLLWSSASIPLCAL